MDEQKKRPALRCDSMPMGTEWGIRRALMRGLGFSSDDLTKPHIAIINTWSSMNPGHVHLREVAEAVKEGVWSAGGLPLMFNALNLCDGTALVAGEYVLPSRDLLVNEIEVMVESNGLDAMVLLGACDKIIPGITMAAARLNLPTIIVTGGYMVLGDLHGKRIHFPSVAKTVGAYLEGTKTKEEMMELIDTAAPSPGACGMMGTANTMALVCEALGMTLPGNATTRAGSPQLIELAREAGRQILRLWENQLTARQIITDQSIQNAVRVCMAIGGSTNSLIHIPAIATEANLKADVPSLYDQASHDVPLLIRVAPNGDDSMQDFDEAGGLPALENELGDLLDHSCMTVTGKTKGENIAGWKNYNPKVIRTLETGYTDEGGIAILKGNICPQGAAVKQSAVPSNLMTFRGPARVFYTAEEACFALRDGKIKSGDCVVILFKGPKAGPGLTSTYSFTGQLAGTTLAREVCMVTDGRFSGAAEGAVIGYVSPEAAMKGPIAAVQDGDIITYDIHARTLNVELSDEEIAKRLAAFDRKCVTRDGYLGIYQTCVRPLMEGAVLRGRPEL